RIPIRVLLPLWPSPVAGLPPAPQTCRPTVCAERLGIRAPEPVFTESAQNPLRAGEHRHSRHAAHKRHLTFDPIVRFPVSMRYIGGDECPRAVKCSSW